MISKSRNRSSNLLISVLIFLSLSVVSLDLSAQAHNDSRWTTTWSTSPSTFPETEENSQLVNDQTLRLIVHTSIGGSALRLRLANYHGEQALNVGAVSIALQSEGGSVQANSILNVSFGGESSVTIAHGAVVLSDPIQAEVPELTNVSVSIYLPEESGVLTGHALSNQTNYVSESGNHVASSNLPIASETPAWSLLTAIDVISESDATAIAMVGDSITDGWGSTISTNNRWPNHFARRVFADASISNYAIVNAGISGNQVTTAGNTMFGQNLQARFERDVLALSNVTHMVLMEGINDIGMATMEGRQIYADQVIAGYKQIIARAHARGIKVIAATLTPFEDAVYFSPEGEEARQTVNTFIRTGGAFDGVIDFDKAVQDPSHPSRILPSFTQDNLHPNDAGYKVMADSIDLDLFR